MVIEGRAASIPRFRPAVRACRYAPQRFLSLKYNLWHSYIIKTGAPQDKVVFLVLQHQDRGTPRKDCVPVHTPSRPWHPKKRLCSCSYIIKTRAPQEKTVFLFLHHQDRGTPRKDCVPVPTSSRSGRSRPKIFNVHCYTGPYS
jgi:hypothetical protein